MKSNLLLRHGIAIASLAAFGCLVLFAFIAFLSYQSDKTLIAQWDVYTAAEDQLFLIRRDVNRLHEIEHRLAAGEVRPADELDEAGEALKAVPSLALAANRRISLLKQVQNHLAKGRLHDAAGILEGRAFTRASRDLRDRVFEYEMNERARLQSQLSDRLERQSRILEFDIAAIMLAIVLLVAASALTFFYVQRLRRFDRDLVIARHEAERASRLKSSFLANMSHEIRTPLNGVLGLTRLLRETKLKRDQEEIVSSLEASGRTLLALVNDILDLSKIESGKIEVEHEPFSVSALIEDLDKAFRPSAERKKLRLVLENPLGALGARGDVTKVRQVLQNLLSNAIKFTTHGEIRLKLSLRGDRLRFEVSDTGIGIPEEAQARIFHPFEQADTSTSRLHGGSGLGLTICRYLVTAMGGRIHMKSDLGAGSSFLFEIPYEPAEAPAPPPPPSQPERVQAAPPVSSSPHLLLVEDNEVNAHLVVSFLKRRGFDVDVATDGEKALEIAKRNVYDLVLMDIHLPQKDGLETAQDLRSGLAGAANAKVPIVALTASAIKGERERCLDAGMNEFLTKPIDLDLLEQTIRHYVGAAPVKSPQSSDGRRAPDLDDDLRAELFELFRKVTPPRLEQIREAVGRSDWKAAGKIAHTMKSSAAQLGFFDLADLCQRLEAKGFAGNGEGWEEDLAQLENACAEVSQT